MRGEVIFAQIFIDEFFRHYTRTIREYKTGW